MYTAILAPVGLMKGAPGNRPPPTRSAEEWYVVLNDPDASDEDWAAFRAWAGDSANRRAYRDVVDTMALIDAAPDAGTAERAGEGEPSSFSRAAGRFLRRTASAAFAAPRPAAVVAGAFLVLLAGFATARHFAFDVETGAFRTALGEQRTETLSDGTTVALNTETALEYRLSKRARTVRMPRGQAIFEVAPDAARPFTVIAAHGVVKATGTQFEVYSRPEDTVVTLIEGAVTVAPGAGGEGPFADLLRPFAKTPPAVALAEPGQQIAVAENGQASPPRRVDARATTQWRSGKVHFVDAALKDAIEEMNRYSRVKLVLQDPALGAARLSGVFNVGDAEVFAQSLELFMPVETRLSDDAIRISAKNSEAEKRK